MKQLTIAGTVLLALGLVSASVDSAPVDSARAADDPSDKPAGEAPQAPGKALQFQEFDDPVLRLQPVKPRDAGEEARLEAMAWFGAGRVLQDRGDLNGALRSYRKAIARDPNAIAVYRVAIPLAMELRQAADAARWIVKAVELDPDDLQLLLRAVAVMIASGDEAGAMQFLEMASKAPSLDRQSPQYVLIMSDLSLLYDEADRTEDAAAGFEVVFDALINPDKYKLTTVQRNQLLRNQKLSFERMGQVFLSAKKTGLALAAFNKAAEKRGSSTGNLSFNIASVYLQEDKASEALEEIQKYIDRQQQAKGRAAYELLEAILKKLGKSQTLIPRLEEAAGKDPRNSALQYFLAEQYSLANRLAEAEKLFKATLESAPDAQGYVGLAGTYRRQGRPADLIEALGRAHSETRDLKGLETEFKAITGDEKLLTSLLELGTKRLEQNPPTLEWNAGYVLANLAADGKKTDVAERLYRYLLPLRRESADKIYEELAGCLTEARRFTAAAGVYQEAIDDASLAEQRPKYLYLQSYPLELGGDTKKALEAIGAAEQMIPNNPVLRHREAWIHYHSHHFDEAISQYEKLIADFPQGGDRKVIRRAQFELSNCYVLHGDLQKGMEVLEAVYKSDPNDTQANNDLGYLYADNGVKLEQAEGMIRKALAVEPENAAYLDSMGWVLFKLGKAEEALPFLEKAVKNSTGGGDETLYDHLADVYDRLRQPAKAVETWKKALELAKAADHRDTKLIERIEEKLKNQQQDQGRLKPQRPGAP